MQMWDGPGNVTCSRRLCPVSKLHDSGLQRLQSADDVAVNWLKGMAMKVLAK